MKKWLESVWQPSSSVRLGSTLSDSMNNYILNHHLKRTEIIESSLATILPHLNAAPIAGKRIFMTGGTGFFGLWLLFTTSLLNRQGADIRVTVLSRDPNRFLDAQPHWRDLPWLSFILGNVRDFDFPEARFDLLIHAATDTQASAHANPLSIFDDIVVGTRRVLDFAVRAGVKRVLLASSGAVYGLQPPEVSHIPEDARFACPPDTSASAYGEGKRVMELLGALYHQEYGIEPIIARCFAFVGPGLPLDAHFAIGNFIRDALYGDAINVNGDGTPLRSYLYSADLAVWLLHLLGSGKPCFPYNVGSDQAISIRELAYLVQSVLSPGKEVRIQKPAMSVNELRQRYVPAINRGRDLGLDVWTSVEVAIERTAKFLSATSEVVPIGRTAVGTSNECTNYVLITRN